MTKRHQKTFSISAPWFSFQRSFKTSGTVWYTRVKNETSSCSLIRLLFPNFIFIFLDEATSCKICYLISLSAQTSLSNIDLSWVMLLFPIRPLLGLMIWNWIDEPPCASISLLQPTHRWLWRSAWWPAGTDWNGARPELKPALVNKHLNSVGSHVVFFN